jgi:phospholipid-translocating ATPase
LFKETIKFFSTKFFEWDEKMYDAARDLPAKANSSDLNEDLGQIKYLFSDKTGTLTENEMIFKQLYVNGKTYCEKDNRLYDLSHDLPI